MSEPSATYLDGLRAARKVVERQTDLTDLVHFERPSDFRKGVLTCLVALDNEIEAQSRRSEPACYYCSQTLRLPNPECPNYPHRQMERSEVDPS